MKGLFPLYLRREPTRDGLLIERAPAQAAKTRDVVAYRDAACTIRAAVWPWHYASKPDRRFRRVMFNCYQWAANWLPDLV